MILLIILASSVSYISAKGNISFFFYIHTIAAEQGYLFEGDMVMSKEQIKENLKGGPSPNAFGLQRSQYRKWPGGVVPYTLASSISKRKNTFIELRY